MTRVPDDEAPRPPTSPTSPTARQVLRQVANPPNPWIKATRSHDLDLGPPPEATLSVFEDTSRAALSKNDSPDIPFTWSVNPYRGCYHGCAYCYARPTHEYLDLGAGTDFERKLVVKPDIAALLDAQLAHPRWTGELIVFSGNTDCYQPLEASYGLTRSCLEVCLRYRNPVGIITKSALIERDLELLAELAAVTHLTVTVSIPFLDDEVARSMEPYAPSPSRRLRTIERLAKANIPVGLNASPIVPGLNDQDLPKLLELAREAGARYANRTMVRLPGPVKEVFADRLRLLLPLKADKILHQIEEARGGQLYDSRFGERMRGRGARWRMIDDLFQATQRRLGFEPMPPPPEPSPFRRPPKVRAQLELGL